MSSSNNNNNASTSTTRPIISLMGPLRHKSEGVWEWTGLWMFGLMDDPESYENDDETDANKSNTAVTVEEQQRRQSHAKFMSGFGRKKGRRRHDKGGNGPSGSRPFRYCFNFPIDASVVTVPWYQHYEEEDDDDVRSEDDNDKYNNAEGRNKDVNKKKDVSTTREATSTTEDEKRNDNNNNSKYQQSIKGGVSSSNNKIMGSVMNHSRQPVSTDGVSALSMNDNKATTKASENSEMTASTNINDQKKEEQTRIKKLKSSSSSISTNNPTIIENKKDKTKSFKQQQDSSSVSRTTKQVKTSDDVVTFATITPFEDASKKYTSVCPPGGSWKGYFENVQIRKDRKTSRVSENFYLFFNSMVPEKVKSFYDISENQHMINNYDNELINSTKIYPKHHIHVRGRGSNQFGTFELIGRYNIKTSILYCHRSYIIMPDAANTTTSTTNTANNSTGEQRVAVAGTLSDKSSSELQQHNKRSSYYTRKRTLKWQKHNSSLVLTTTAAHDLDDATTTMDYHHDEKQHQRKSKKMKLTSNNNLAGGGDTIVDPTSTDAANNTIEVLQGLSTVADVLASTFHSSIEQKQHGGNSTTTDLSSVATSRTSSGTGGKRNRALSNAGPSPSGSAGGRPSPSPNTFRRSSSLSSIGGGKKHHTMSPGLMELPKVSSNTLFRWKASHIFEERRLIEDPMKNRTSSTSAAHTAGAGATITTLAVVDNDDLSTGTTSTTTGGGGITRPTYVAHVLYEGDLTTKQHHSASSGGSNTNTIIREGLGVCRYENGYIYEGWWRRNKEHGKGILMTSDRKYVIYEGDWEKGRMHGKGTYYYTKDVTTMYNSSNNNSDIEDSALHRATSKLTAVASPQSWSISSTAAGAVGAATTTTASSAPPPLRVQRGGGIYKGEFKEGLRHGFGIYNLSDGSIYEGEWRDNVQNGRGIFQWNDGGGSIYEGQWKDGKRHGQGILKVSDGFIYEGQWVYDSMDGRGTCIYPNGQQYEGMWSKGKKEGRGTITFPNNGGIYEGRFKDDEMEGQGTMKLSTNVYVVQPNVSSEEEEEENENDHEKDKNTKRNKLSNKEHHPTPSSLDWFMPLQFQSNMSRIHQRAGFSKKGC